MSEEADRWVRFSCASITIGVCGLIVAVLIWLYSTLTFTSDHLIAAAASPDGRLVARLWQPDHADMVGRDVLTISPADRIFPDPPPHVEANFVYADLPQDDIAAELEQRPLRVFYPWARLRWVGLSELRVEGHCHTIRVQRTAPVRITLVETAESGSCGGPSR